MIHYEKPTFIVKKYLQKSRVTGRCFSDEVTPEVLCDICLRITGLHDFTYQYVENEYYDELIEPTYNKGRLAILLFRDTVSYISFSEAHVGGRNSSIQSVPTAFNLYYNCPYPNKRLYYYFLNAQGNLETDYQILIYRLMNSIGFEFINATPDLIRRVPPFSSVDDIMCCRQINAGRNHSNNSSYITRNGHGIVEIYGKTYGANKYETSLMCYALACLWDGCEKISLYEILEGDLRELPSSSMSVILDMGMFNIYPTDMMMEKRVFESGERLRSPRYIYNLLSKLGNKHCPLCGCEIPQLIQGAHVLPVAAIRRNLLSSDEKVAQATDGDNGLWLCENHHKLFDENFFIFDDYGRLFYRNNIGQDHLSFIEGITVNDQLPDYILTDAFMRYMWQRRQIYGW